MTNPTLAPPMPRLDELKAQLAQIDGLMQSGVLTGAAAAEARARLEAEVLAEVLKPGARDVQSKASARPAEPSGPSSAVVEASARLSGQLVLGVTVFVLAFGVLGYAVQGNRAGWALGPGSGAVAAAAATAAEAASAPAGIGREQLEAMVERLAERLKGRADDTEGWTMLGRSYGILGRHADAVKAFRQVLELRPKDAQAHADLAEALGMANGRRLEGDPEKSIAAALQLDPANAKALALAGSAAFERGDAPLAVAQWERALRQAEPGSDTARQLQGAIDEARQRIGPGAAPASTASGQGGAARQAGGMVTGPASSGAAVSAEAAAVQVRVSLAPALAARAAPDDTVFIFARAMAGPKAPLAIQRRQVKDLPLTLTLDDTMAMSPALRLSSVAQVVIGARISKSGNAMPQPGDLQGLSPAIAVGTRDLALEIGEVVR